MKASQDVLKLLERILAGECGRASLATWLAECSLAYLNSPNETDRMIVADLDAALGEVQRDEAGEEFLWQTAQQLVVALRLPVAGAVITVDVVDASVDKTPLLTMTSSNSGGTFMASRELVLSHESR